MGSRRVTAVDDPTGNNTGKWTVVFDPLAISIAYTKYEVYKMVVELASVAGIVSWIVSIGIFHYEGFEAQSIATWSDSQAMIVDSGETVYFYFNEPSSDSTPPVVTIWTQVDDSYARKQ